jgi:predicted nucleic acid-binding protein
VIVLVDSSAWIDYFNGADSVERAAVRRLLDLHAAAVCGVIVAEVLQGIRSNRQRDLIEASLRELPFLDAIGFDPHARAAALFRALRGRGITVRSTIDCLIAVLAAEHGCPLLARDRDLIAIAESKVLPLELWRLA